MIFIFNKAKMQKIAELLFNPDIYYNLKMNKLVCNINIYREWETFPKAQKD